MPTDGAGEAESSVTEVVAYIFERHPHCARRAGLHEYDACLPTPVPRSQAGLTRLRTAVLTSSESLPPAADRGLRADLDAAAKFLEAEQFEADHLGWDYPAPPDQLAEVDVSGYLRGPYAPLPERIAALGAHMKAIPEFLRRACGMLGASMPAGMRLRCMEGAILQAARLRGLAGHLAAAHRGLDVDQVAAGAEPAAVACEEYARALAAVTPEAGILGPELLTAYLRATEGVEQPVTELLAEARHEVAALLTALDALAAQAGADGRAQAWGLLTRQVRDCAVVDAMQSAIDTAREFWQSAGIVGVSVVNPLQVALMPAGSGSAEVVFDVAGPLEKVPQSHILYVPDLRGDGPQSVRRQYLNDPTLAVVALHETFVGHYVHTEASLRGSGVLRSCIRWTAGFPEGWSHYAEELAVEFGFGCGQPLIGIAQLRSALEAAVRLLLFLSVHLRHWSFSEAVQQATELCLWSRERAVREVLITTAYPATVMYALGKLRIRAWRRSVGASRAQLRDFHAGILAGGYAPLSTVWNHYLDAGRVARKRDDSETGWRHQIKENA